tara:strand:+ start:837 stop:1259 length:423 start_codon:yes stop_codon:yes gene_type:complete
MKMKYFSEIEQEIGASVKAYIEDNLEHITEARKEYIEDNGQIDGSFYEDEMYEASYNIADDATIYTWNSYEICMASRLGNTDEMQFFFDAEANGTVGNDIDEIMTNIANHIVYRLAMSFFSEYLLMEDSFSSFVKDEVKA